MSGCRDDHYSYDAKIGRACQAAMSYFAVKIIEEAGYDITWSELARKLVPPPTDGISEPAQAYGEAVPPRPALRRVQGRGGRRHH